MDNSEIIKSVMNNKPGATKDIVCLNAGTAIYVSGIANSLAAGIEKAEAVIADGSALKKMDATGSVFKELLKITCPAIPPIF